MSNGGEESLLILSLKWWLTYHHLVQQDPVCPPVHGKSIGLVVDNFWGNIVWGPTECLGSIPIQNSLLAQPKVCNLDVPLLVNHDVVQLEVPVDDTMTVEVEDTDGYFCCIKPRNMSELFRIENSWCKTDVATGSLNFPTCCIWYIRSPPATYSRTK